MTTRLISVDSHVKMTPEQIKAHMPSKFHRDFDDAIAAEAAAHQADMGGLDPKVLAAGFSHIVIDRERPSLRACLGAVIAVIGVAILVWRPA